MWAVSFSELLKSAKAAKQEPVSATVEVTVGAELVTLKFRELPGVDWVNLTREYPVRPGVVIDRRYGYDLDAVCKAAAETSGVLVQGGEEVTLQVDPVVPGSRKPRVNEWADLFEVLSGPDTARVVDAIWALNEYNPAQRTEALKKASRVESKTNSPSPEN